MKNVSLYMLSSFFLFLIGSLMILLGLNFLYYDMVYMLDWEFITLNSMLITLTLIFDWMSMFFCGCVFFISSMVVLYSHSYMYDDENKVRFLYLVLMFIFSMFMMIMSPNLISILLGWDGLGLVSYCLVIYFQNFKSFSAGMLTILTNRIGDVAILLSIAWMMNFGSWHFFYYLNIFESWLMYLMFLLVLAGFTKSAQIPFSSWLPAAMAAPTPVSALVHSSTLVTAGVYLLIRFSDLLYMFNCSYFLVLSMMTMFMSGLGANFEFDLKKIIALSTLSQLGLMMTILFMGYPYLSYFHLLTHAFFKALLFLCAGLIIHVMNNTQDIRFMGGLTNQLPFTITCFSVSNLSLCGFPYLAGFYSKDLILEVMTFNGSNMFIYFIMYISVGLTVSYSIRLIYYTMIMNTNSYANQSFSEDKFMNLSMLFLVIMSIVSGSMLSWLIFSTPVFLVIPFFMKIFALIMILFGMFLGYELSIFYYNIDSYYMVTYKLSSFLGSMWFMPPFSTYFLSGKFLNYSFMMTKNLEVGWGEFIFSKMSFTYMVILSKFTQFYYYNNLKIFMISFFLFIFMFMIY
uniref:NADH dehydrogenase subunit 5 n=1 Tax=Potamometra macrokosos TaxID=2853723 RepID=UPI001EE12555|nr:NADH dehydrogenase subunit 5 [Potamometra macrokosos]UJY96842.1 NADH dehydrogenase subunit 5 [Potamometra macrokosos]UJY96855.1 NADH dehydrogenase subunit 5 [Potamometra macrokosos]UJY96868.1 NADH dehydrogenase subunit 5 [Potamometra macrokosos]UJY96881.1 NADH dehydrogenase subunit 5 [Potamometra macrokosos]